MLDASIEWIVAELFFKNDTREYLTLHCCSKHPSKKVLKVVFTNRSHFSRVVVGHCACSQRNGENGHFVRKRSEKCLFYLNYFSFSIIRLLRDSGQVSATRLATEMRPDFRNFAQHMRLTKAHRITKQTTQGE